MRARIAAAAAARRFTVCAAAICAVAALAAGCGGSSGGGGSTSGSAAAGQTTQAPTAAELASRVALAKCLRAHGLQVPDPSASGQVRGATGSLLRTLTQRYGQAKLQAAFQACRSDLANSFPRLQLTPAQRAQREKQLLAFAQCMRAHGIDIPDPQPNVVGGFGLGRALRNLDRQSPKFQTAMTACGGLRPARLRPGGSSTVG